MYSPFKKHLLGFPGGSAGKEPVYSAGDLGSIPGLGSSIGEGNGYLLQYSGLENSMDCIVHRVAESPTWLSSSHFHFLMVQWLALCALTAEGVGSIPGQRSKIPLAMWPKNKFKKNLRNLPAMQETQVQSLGGEDPLEKGMVTHSGILAWRILWTEESGELQSIRVAKSRTWLRN